MLKDDAWKRDAKSFPAETSMDSAVTINKYLNWL